MIFLATFWGYLSVTILIVAGITGFLVGTGNAGFFIAPRDHWTNSPAEMTTRTLGIGLFMAGVFVVGTAWLLSKIIKFFS
jgi:hypothetical protein